MKAVQEQPLADPVALRFGENGKTLDKARAHPKRHRSRTRQPYASHPGQPVNAAAGLPSLPLATRRSRRQKGVKAVASTSSTPRGEEVPARRSAAQEVRGAERLSLSSTSR